MSFQFLVTRIVRLDVPATGTCHDGSPLTVDDFPAGTIMAQDEKSDWFVFRGPAGLAATLMSFPKTTHKPALQFRDYWRFVCHDHDTAPMFAAILTAARAGTRR